MTQFQVRRRTVRASDYGGTFIHRPGTLSSLAGWPWPGRRSPSGGQLARTVRLRAWQPCRQCHGRRPVAAMALQLGLQV
eukprot:513838-Hanusia_phi.AAC.1